MKLLLTECLFKFESRALYTTSGLSTCGLHQNTRISCYKPKGPCGKRFDSTCSSSDLLTWGSNYVACYIFIIYTFLQIGNPAFDFVEDNNAETLFLWARGLNNDDNEKIVSQHCDWNTYIQNDLKDAVPKLCESGLNESDAQAGEFINYYDVILDVCLPESATQEMTLRNMKVSLLCGVVFSYQLSQMIDIWLTKTLCWWILTQEGVKGHVQKNMGVDVCLNSETTTYLNRQEVQIALHANTTGLRYTWSMCST